MSIKPILQPSGFEDKTKNLFANSLSVSQQKTNLLEMTAQEQTPEEPDNPNSVLYLDDGGRLSAKNSFGDLRGFGSTYFCNPTIFLHLDDNLDHNSLMDRSTVFAVGNLLSRPNMKNGTLYHMHVHGTATIGAVASADIIARIGLVDIFVQSVTFQVGGSQNFNVEVHFAATEQDGDNVKINYVYDIQNGNTTLAQTGQSLNLFPRNVSNRLDIVLKWNGINLNNSVTTRLCTLRQLN
jgi:hypothetical protein